MAKGLGVISTAVLLSIALIFFDIHFGSGSLTKALDGQVIPMLATVLSMGISAMAIAIGNLTSLEMQAKKRIFSNTKREIKHNIFFMIGGLIVSVAVVAFQPHINDQSSDNLRLFACALSATNLTVLMLYIYALFDITCIIFSIDKSLD